MTWISLLEVIYPVGSIYFSTNSTSPSSIVGGTWSAMTGGMLGLAGSTGVATAGSNGGSITISITQLPSHEHPVYTTSGTIERVRYHMSASTIGSGQVAARNASGNSSLNYTYEVGQAVGGGQNFIPAHSSVYCWKRTA